MMDKASVFRTEESLAEMIRLLDGLKEPGRAGSASTTRARSSTTTSPRRSSSATSSTSPRPSSSRPGPGRRAAGAHWREDHPLRDDANWMKHSMVTRQPDGTVTLEYKPVDGDLYVPMERKY
jgi:succinate dehydrogenase / fumarate reductase flavoprotein subunit